MIIVSPNGKIINFENLVEIYVTRYDMYPLKNDIEGYCLKGTVSSGKYIVLGTYETEERAKEVLKEIWKFYEISKRYECSSNNGITIFLEPKFAYQMPER